MTLQANWMDEMTYPTSRYRKLLQRYCDAFVPLFRCPLRNFGYERWLKSGLTVGVSSLPEMANIYFETEGYKDNPFFVEHEFTTPGTVFIWPDYTQEYECNNAYRHALREKLGISGTFGILEKTKNYCHYLSWTFNAPLNLFSPENWKNFILGDFLSNHAIIRAILDHFKAKFFPIIEKEDLCRVNLRDLSAVYAKPNAIVSQNAQYHDIQGLLDGELLSHQDLKLREISLTRQEEKVLHGYLKGMTASEIGSQLFRSRRTIEMHINSIKDKLGASKRSEIFQMARKLKWMGVID